MATRMYTSTTSACLLCVHVKWLTCDAHDSRFSLRFSLPPLSLSLSLSIPLSFTHTLLYPIYLFTFLSFHIPAEPLPPPTNVRLTGVSANSLDFAWTPAQTNCSTRYVVTSDCGDCATSSNLQTDQPTASCSFQPPSTADSDRVCTLAVQSVICRNLSSAMSAPVSVNLRGKLAEYLCIIA